MMRRKIDYIVIALFLATVLALSSMHFSRQSAGTFHLENKNMNSHEGM